jgi:hypothetical protein
MQDTITTSSMVTKRIGGNMKTDDILRELDDRLDEVDALINQLYLNPAVKKKLSAKVYELWEEVEGAIDLTPTDWE